MPFLFAIVFSVMAAFAVLLPSIMYVLEGLGADKALATRILASYSIAQFFMAPVLGRLSDRIGRKSTLVIGLCLALTGYGMLALWGDSLGIVFAGLVVAGVSSGTVAVAFAAVTDLTTSENRAKGMGMLGAGIGLAFTLGPATGAIISAMSAGALDIQMPATASVVVLLLGLLASSKLPAKLSSRKAGEHQMGHLAGFKLLWSKPALMNLGLMMFVFTLALSLMEPIMPYLIRDRYDWGAPEMGYLFGFAGMVAVLVQAALVGRLVAVYGEQRIVVAGIVFMGMGLAAIAWAPHWSFILLALACTSVGGALFNTSIFALTSKNASERDRGLFLGAVQSMQSLSRASGPMVSGNLFQIMSILPVLVGLGGMVLLLAWAGKPRR